MRLEVSSAKCCSFRLGLNVLKPWQYRGRIDTMYMSECEVGIILLSNNMHNNAYETMLWINLQN